MTSLFRRSLVSATCFVAIAGLAACSGDDDSTGSTKASSAPQATSGANIAPQDDALTGDLIGAGCAGYNSSQPSGAGSLAGMAQDPVAQAAANNPLLTTLTSALSGKLNPNVNLVDTLNSGQFTVFAPTNDAFKQVDAATLAKLKTDKVLLSNVLTYHVVAGQFSPTKLSGTQSTVEGATVQVTGSGNDMKVNGADILCGGVKTANATVYLIDKVLMPPAKK